MAEKAVTLREAMTPAGNKYARDRVAKDVARDKRMNAANADLAAAMKSDKGPGFGKQSPRISGPGRSPSKPMNTNNTKVDASKMNSAAKNAVTNMNSRGSSSASGIPSASAATPGGQSTGRQNMPINKPAAKPGASVGGNSNFGSSFAAARKAGKDSFTFNGKSYNTMRADGKPLSGPATTAKMAPKEDTWANMTRTGRSNGGMAAVTSTGSTGGASKSSGPPAKVAMVIKDPTMGYGRIRGVKERDK